MNDFNDIGISRQLDMPRIQKLLGIGLFASVLHFLGDMILGWGVEDETLTGILRMLSAYTGTSDGGIFAVALLGLFGMVLEGCLSPHHCNDGRHQYQFHLCSLRR